MSDVRFPPPGAPRQRLSQNVFATFALPRLALGVDAPQVGSAEAVGSLATVAGDVDIAICEACVMMNE